VEGGTYLEKEVSALFVKKLGTSFGKFQSVILNEIEEEEKKGEVEFKHGTAVLIDFRKIVS
jgi:hypothetical protein